MEQTNKMFAPLLPVCEGAVQWRSQEFSMGGWLAAGGLGAKARRFLQFSIVKRIFMHISAKIVI